MGREKRLILGFEAASSVSILGIEVSIGDGMKIKGEQDDFWDMRDQLGWRIEK